MRDDAIYCEHPNPEDPELAYIPYYKHCFLALHDHSIIVRLSWACGLLAAALIAALVIR